MKIKIELCTRIEGDIGEISGPDADRIANAAVVLLPTIEQITASMRELAFIAESVGHLRNMPAAVEAADRARSIITKLGG